MTKKKKIPRKGLLFRHEWSELTEVKPAFHMSEKSQTIGDFTFCRPFQILPVYRMKPVFHMSGKSQTSRDSTFCRPSQILPIYRIIARSLSQILPIINLAGNEKCAKNWILNTNIPAFVQQHGCTRAYAASFSIHLPSVTRQCKVFYSGKAESNKKRYTILLSLLDKTFETAITDVFSRDAMFICDRDW